MSICWCGTEEPGKQVNVCADSQPGIADSETECFIL